MVYRLLILLLLLANTAFGLLADAVILRTHTRFVQDSNIYNRTEGNETQSLIVSQIASLQLNVLQDERTRFKILYTPKIDKRFFDNEELVYHTFKTDFQRALNRKVQVKSSYSYMLTEREPTSDIDTNVDITATTKKATAQISYTPKREHSFVIKYENKQKEWSENLETTFGLTNGDYDQHNASVQYVHELWKGRLFSTQSADYSYHTFVGDRGGYEKAGISEQLMYVLNPKTYITLKGGYEQVLVTDENEHVKEFYEPYAAGGINSQLFKNLTLGLNVKYAVVESGISTFNVAKKITVIGQMKYDITGKTKFIFSTVGMRSAFDADYARNSRTIAEEKVDYLLINTASLAYDINRNQALELGYQGPLVNPEADTAIIRHKTYFGYRLTF